MPIYLACVDLKKDLTLNICSNKSQKTYDLVKLIFKKLNCRDNLISVIKDKKRSRKLVKMIGNNQKAITNLKWRPKISVDLGLDDTIKWLKTNKNVNKYISHE